jgi:RNA polymerase sigma-70 factor (ECF subfamily)
VGQFERRDEELLPASVTDRAAFVEFYRRHAHGLLAFFARRTLDAQVAADLTAETVADAFAGRARFRDRGDGSATAWLYTIARRKLDRFIRRRTVERTARVRMGMDRLELGDQDVERVEALIDFEQIGRAVAAALVTLSPEQRDAVRLRVLEGESYAQVAAHLGCSAETARARVSRALRTLARELGSEAWT